VVGHLVAVPLAQDDLPDFHVPHEHLVEVATLAMSFDTRVNRQCEVEMGQLLNDIAHVVVEVTTYDNRSMRVLPDDVPRDFGYPFGPLIQVRLFPWMEIAVKHLHILVAQFQLGPAEVCPQCLHQLQSGVGSGRIPTSPAALFHGLI